jgi:hypothetical protein
VYEYLAMGRPVVSTPMQALLLENTASAIAFAHDPTEFCSEIERCLTKAVQDDEEARRRVVAAYSWDSLFDHLDSVCSSALAN